MRVPCSVLWPPNDPVEQLLHWSFIAGKLGCAPIPQRPFLIGIRGATHGDAETHQPIHRAKYDDAFVLLQPTKPLIVFPGATHAYQFDSKLSPDVNRDGRGDVGSIRTGRYLLTDKGAQPHPIFVLTMPDGSGEIPAHRDTDHDGVISQAEAERSEQARTGRQVSEAGHFATAVLFHTGYDAPPNAAHRSSIACLTCNLRHLELMREAAKPYGRQIDLALVNAWDLVPLAEERRRELPVDDEPTRNDNPRRA